MFSRQSPRRSQQRNNSNSKAGIKLRNVVQICLLLGACIWLLNYPALGDKPQQKVDNKVSYKPIKLGRKDLEPRGDQAAQVENPKDEDGDKEEESTRLEEEKRVEEDKWHEQENVSEEIEPGENSEEAGDGGSKDDTENEGGITDVEDKYAQKNDAEESDETERRKEIEISEDHDQQNSTQGPVMEKEDDGEDSHWKIDRQSRKENHDEGEEAVSPNSIDEEINNAFEGSNGNASSKMRDEDNPVQVPDNGTNDDEQQDSSLDYASSPTNAYYETDIAGVEDNRVDSSATSLPQEEKEARTDLDTLPDSATDANTVVAA